MIAAMASISTKRGRIGVDEAGSNDQLPIIFLHGVGSDKSVWRRQLEHFGRTRRAVAFDYPGYGESEFVEAATRDDFAASIFAWLMRCTQYVHFSITPRVRTVTSGLRSGLSAWVS